MPDGSLDHTRVFTLSYDVFPEGNDSYQSWESAGMSHGSGNHWSDGMQFSDWSLNGGSQIYRNGLAAGLTDIGGNLYEIEDGRRNLYSERNGKSGLWRDEDFTDYWVEDGKLHRAPGVMTKFVPFAQQGPVTEWWSARADTNVDYFGMKVIFELPEKNNYNENCCYTYLQGNE